MSFLHIGLTQVLKTLPQVREGPTYSIQSISWLLMSWRRKEPGHQQPWYWPSQTEITRSPHVKGFNSTWLKRFHGVVFRGAYIAHYVAIESVRRTLFNDPSLLSPSCHWSAEPKHLYTKMSSWRNFRRWRYRKMTLTARDKIKSPWQHFRFGVQNRISLYYQEVNAIISQQTLLAHPWARVRYEVPFEFKLSSILYLRGCNTVINIVFYCTRTREPTLPTETEMSSSGWHFFHWLLQKLPLWWHPLQPTSDENLSKWQHEHFSANTKIIRAFCSCSDHSQYWGQPVRDDVTT